MPPGALARLGTVRFRHGSSINSVAFSPDGTLLAVREGSNSGIVCLCEVKTGKEIRQFRGTSGHYAGAPVAFSPDGTELAMLIEQNDFTDNEAAAVHLLGAGAVVRANRVSGGGSMGVIAENAKAAII